MIALPKDYQLLSFDQLDSTNDEARRQADNPSLDKLVIQANSQNKGRGRRGRTWVSEKGNLFCSILQRPNVPIQMAAQISFVSALAIHGAIREAVDGFDCDVLCKWPNDVLVDGYKVSGILLESQVKKGTQDLDWIITGIGINLCHSPADTPYPCGFINAYRENNLTAQMMLELLLKHYDEWMERWKTFGFQTIRDAWCQNAKGIGEEIIVKLSDEEIVGCFESLDQDGALVLRNSEGTRHITAGDVFFK
jgi:BirA family biotin operon repressor/biotin-[acetyl-CoA-carboxylase] ligase